jgi:RHS repeat-associated protein
VAVLATSVDANQVPVTTGNAFTLSYWHRDHLGSVTVTTDAAGAVVNRSSYDPWGKPRASFPLGDRSRTGDRGFTGHEHLAGGLIHMNGRIYDPVLGRFLSADIVVQFPDAITSYNRYAYVLNNPLAYTDPSGYFIEFIIAAYASIASTYGVLAMIGAIAFDAGLVALATGHKTAARRFFSAWLMIATGGMGGEYAALWKIGGAFAAGGLQSGSIEGAIMSAFTAGMFSMAGGIADAQIANIVGAATEEYASTAAASAFGVGGLGRAGMHFAAGAMSAMIKGQDPLRGGFSAGFAEIAGPWASGTDVGVKQFAAHVVAGGIGEVIGGGKFANGAMTGAFAWLYNHLNTFSASDSNDRGEPTRLRESADRVINSAAGRSTTEYWSMGHGSPGLVLGQDGNPITVQQHAALINADPTFSRGQTVRLFHCDVASPGPVKPFAVYAQQLADILQSPVIAPTSYVWYNTGHDTPTPLKFDSRSGSFNLAPLFSAKDSSAWKTFLPRR